MRAIAFCCVLLLLVACDTLGGEIVVLKLKPSRQTSQAVSLALESDVQHALQVIDRFMASEGLNRATPNSSEQHQVAYYLGGPFGCTVRLFEDELFVDFRNPGFGAGGRATPAVKKVSGALAEKLKSEYGVTRVRVDY